MGVPPGMRNRKGVHQKKRHAGEGEECCMAVEGSCGHLFHSTCVEAWLISCIQDKEQVHPFSLFLSLVRSRARARSPARARPRSLSLCSQLGARARCRTTSQSPRESPCVSRLALSSQAESLVAWEWPSLSLVTDKQRAIAWDGIGSSSRRETR